MTKYQTYEEVHKRMGEAIWAIEQLVHVFGYKINFWQPMKDADGKTILWVINGQTEALNHFFVATLSGHLISKHDSVEDCEKWVNSIREDFIGASGSIH